ncbi:hypothetical protein GWN42_19430 [candidate division KSB1 bacterium]|nr:hypothetical protein [candidate division KSB1 bacterium]
MFNVDTENTLSESAKTVLKSLRGPLSSKEIAGALDQPLYETKTLLDKMVRRGLIAGYKDTYVLTDKGRAISLQK